MFNLAGEKLHGQRQTSGREQLLINRFEDGLCSHALGEAFTQGAKEISLLDILFALQGRHTFSLPGHRGITTPSC
jgi:hypothetical protein